MSEAHDVLQDMENQIAELKACAEARRQAVDKEVAAQGKETASAEQAARAFKSAFLDKLDKLLGDLQDAASDVTKIVSFAAHAAGDLKDVIDSYDKVVPPILNQADGVMQTAAGLVQPFASQARSCADQAAAILAKMRRAAQLRTALERKNVQVSIPGLPRTPTPSALGRLRSSPRIAAFLAESKPITAKLDAARLKLRTLPGGPGAAELNAFAKRVSTDLDAMFNGKSPADRSRQRDDLLAEAQRRYASDTKTLQAVRKLITDQARARGVN